MANLNTVSFKNQNFTILKEDCVKRGKLFCDEEFKLDVPGAVWLRPGEICDNPRFIVDGASRFDAIQGELGDCYLIAAIANLPSNQLVFQQVVPSDQSFEQNYCGIFHFRIWQYGDWVDIVVDDKLPTKNRELLYTHSKQKNEFWSALLEKAYAKLYGTYDQLVGGRFDEAMEDFTGGIAYPVSIERAGVALSDVITSSFERGSFMSVSITDESITSETLNGLLKGHVYSLNKALQVIPKDDKEKLLLVRLRNPWGRVEWQGPWSDSSPEWKSISEEEKSSIGLVIENDGEFWISTPDLIKRFQSMDVCHLSPSVVKFGDVSIMECAIKGRWIEGVNAGGASSETLHKNPQFKFTIPKSDKDKEGDGCSIIMSLMQKNKIRNLRRRIGITTFHIDDPKNIMGPLSDEYVQSNLSNNAIRTNFEHRREMLAMYSWPPGVYCIVPSTFNPDLEGQFLLRIFSDKKTILEEIDDTPPTFETGAQPSTSKSKVTKQLVYKSDQEVQSYFNRITGKGKEIGWQGLQSLLQFALSPSQGLFSRSSDSTDVKFLKFECRTLIDMLDENHSGKLDFEEFQALWSKIRQWESVFLRCSRNTEYVKAPELKQALTSAGYRVSSNTLGRLIKQHADDDGRFTFNDFVMCAVQLQTS